MIGIVEDILLKDGFVLDPLTFEELGHGQWVTEAKSIDNERMRWVIIGYNDLFEVFRTDIRPALAAWCLEGKR